MAMMAMMALPAFYSLQVHLETLVAVVAILVTCIGGLSLICHANFLKGQNIISHTTLSHG